MEQTKSLSTPAISKKPVIALPAPTNLRDYQNDSVPERRWELTIDRNVKVYLTDSERAYFLKHISAGASIVQVGALTLTNRFVCMMPIRNKTVTSELPSLNTLSPEERARSIAKLNEVRQKFIKNLDQKNDNSATRTE